MSVAEQVLERVSRHLSVKSAVFVFVYIIKKAKQIVREMDLVPEELESRVSNLFSFKLTKDIAAKRLSPCIRSSHASQCSEREQLNTVYQWKTWKDLRSK